MRCCDISEYQGTVNFDQLKTAVSAVIIRAGYTGGTDARFVRNRDQARRVGLARGYYWFAYPARADASADADRFLSVIGDLWPGEVLVLDYEVTDGGPAWCKQFMDRVQQRTGTKPLLYTNQNRVVTLDWSAIRNADYGLWVAIFDNDPNADVNTAGWLYAMKQYTADGRLPGVGGPVDLDEFYGTVDTFYKYGYQGGTNMPTLTSREDLDFLYQSDLGRGRIPGEGEDVYLGKDYKFVDQDLWNSGEARQRRADAESQLSVLQQQVRALEATVKDLSSRPTKEQLQAALTKIEDLAVTLEETQAKLNNLPPPPEPPPPPELSSYSLAELCGAIIKKLRGSK
jgi:GH25 family lysozyme M1 (1,4-beta-N-acetylmuramidase)